MKEKLSQTTPKPDHENHLHETEHRWFAVYTKYKCEKSVAKALDTKKIQNYLPLLSVTRRYTRKIKHHELPLINCYIFVKIIKTEYVQVLETENVVKFLRFSKNLLAIPDEEIEILKWVVGEGENVEAEQGVLKEGDLVEVVAGKLTGLKGRLVEKQGKKHMVVELESVGYTLRMSVDTTLLRRI